MRRFILYRKIDPKTKYDMWVLPVGARAGEQKPFPFLATEANEAAAVLSPDGRWVSYTSDESGAYRSTSRASRRAAASARSLPAAGWRPTGAETGKSSSTMRRTES